MDRINPERVQELENRLRQLRAGRGKPSTSGQVEMLRELERRLTAEANDRRREKEVVLQRIEQLSRVLSARGIAVPKWV
jgi:hypothetical protein